MPFIQSQTSLAVKFLRQGLEINSLFSAIPIVVWLAHSSLSWGHCIHLGWNGRSSEFAKQEVPQIACFSGVGWWKAIRAMPIWTKKIQLFQFQWDLFGESFQGLNHGGAAGFSGNLKELRGYRTDNIGFPMICWQDHLCIWPSHLCEHPPRVHRHHKNPGVSQIHRKALEGQLIGKQGRLERPSSTCWARPLSNDKHKVHLQCFQQCLQLQSTSEKYLLSSFTMRPHWCKKIYFTGRLKTSWRYAQAPTLEESSLLTFYM